MMKKSLCIALALVLLLGLSAPASADVEAGLDLSAVRAGEFLSFGVYEQDNDPSNGPEAIEWLVLDQQDGRILLISRFGLDCQKYDPSLSAVTWETSALRAWLNDSFLNTAFSGEERALILPAEVPSDPNSDWRTTDPGNSTEDAVFLLSIPEAFLFFGTAEERQCEATAYAAAQGCDVSENGLCAWWLRTPGRDSLQAAFVRSTGSTLLPNRGPGAVGMDGERVNKKGLAVRPALWLALDP